MILAPIPGAPGVLAVELAGQGGRLALVRDPANPHAVLQVHAEGRTVALRLDITALRVLGRACREAAIAQPGQMAAPDSR